MSKTLLESGSVRLLESGDALLLEEPSVAGGSIVLLESGSIRLLESGDALLLEGEAVLVSGSGLLAVIQSHGLFCGGPS